ncbi:MAG: N-6 DNA methylase [Gammaproteobacteria bacterium]|nr:N-6 DNA methylase [Gammaproteobacteria bacterium]MYH86543.1 N-6 DNA methylase [Gammaproteobacteria bacterium]MYK04757.1 N-6 DNA methylase [Gammaproteobacteria bacterium]
MNNGDLNWITNYIWGIADDILRDLYVRGKYRDVILPMTVLRRLDAVLEDNKQAVSDMKASLDKAEVVEQDAALRQAAGQAFYNVSPFTLRDLRARSNPQQLKADFEAWLDGFSPNVQDILENFEFRNQIPRLAKADALGALIEKLTSPDINLSPDPVKNTDGEIRQPGLDNHGMGTIFEELVRRFNEENNEEAGEHWTPRDAVRLMAKLVFEPVADEIESGTYLLYDGACGTGGMLTMAEDTLQELAAARGKQVSTHLYGQEINAETYAICKADLLLKGGGEAADNIVGGPEHSTLANDAFPSREFDFMLSNPPYGKSWKTDLERMGGKSGMRDPRFLIEHADDPEYSLVTRSSDGQMLFLANKLAKMKQSQSRLGSRIAEVHNGSSLFTGDAGQGESNIRRWIIENDWLEAIVALPLNLFYNTGIATYIWVLTNRKPAHRRGMVQLIDATGWHRPLRKNLGKKNCELGEDDIERICETFLAFEENEQSKIFENADFGYWKVTVERPLRIEGADTTRVYKAAEIKQLKENGKRSEDAPRIIRKIHKRGTEPDALRGLFVAKIDGKHVVVEYEPDPELRDTEQIPLKEEGGIEAFLRREVLPYAEDAWYKPESVRTGYEISFNRYFYKPAPLRSLDEIRADILALQSDADSLLPDFILREPEAEYVAKPRIYVDTSVIGGCHDSEFRDASLQLFDWFLHGKAKLIYSEVTVSELSNAPDFVRETFAEIPDGSKELVLMTEEADQLADAYISSGALGTANRADAEHIALATLAKVDILTSWNFKHMVSGRRIKAYNQVNRQSGFTEIAIKTPEATVHG